MLGVRLQYSHSMGRGENAGTGFRQPSALARGKDDLLYVASRSYDYRPEAKRITMLTVDEELVGEFSQGAGTAGEELNSSAPDGTMVWPSALSCDSQGNLYVVDEWLNRVSIFSPDGEYLSKWGEEGSGDGQLKNPMGIAFDKNDTAYLVDSGNHRVQKFTKDGKFLGKWGSFGAGNGQFNLPWGISLDPQGNVYVADWRNDRIQKFTADGRFLMKFGSSGKGDGQFNRPTGVAVDKDGYIFVTDWGNDRLQCFDPDGEFVTKTMGEGTVSKWGRTKLDANPEMWNERAIAQDLEREKLFWAPVDVKVDDQGRIFVLESPRSRIQVFRKVAPVFAGTRL
jgi:DNA-binding beta-propeller fold protein YncE